MAEDLDSVYIVGRFGITAEDGGDIGDDPDRIWCDTGVISFDPQEGETKVAGGSPTPWTGGQSTFRPTIDAEGYLTWRGQHFMKLVDLTSEKVNPRVVNGKATHSVRFDKVKAGDQTVTFTTRSIRASADMAAPLDNPATAAAYGLPLGTPVIDLTRALPVPVANSVPIVVGPQGTSITALVQPTPGTMALELSNGATTTEIELPVGPGGSDAGVASYLGDPESESAVVLTAKIGTLKAWAKDVDNLIAGAISYTSGLVSSAVVQWPDGLPGVLTITARQASTDAVTNYNVTRVSGSTTTTYTQPTITRDVDGSPTLVPQITVA